MHYHALPPERALEELRASAGGLSGGEAATRLERFGPNRMPAGRRTSAWSILVDQLESVVVLLLLAASVVAVLLGDVVEALAIAAVLLINTVLGFVTELRARRAMEALLRLDVSRARVLRDGAERDIDAAQLVPGDVVRLEAGDAVPADARLLETIELRCNEAALTGESLPVDKHAHATVLADAPTADRTTMLYKGTAVVTGVARALVVATGAATELGRIGGLVRSIEEEATPLERRLDALGRRLIAITFAVTLIVVGVGWLRGEAAGRMLETGIALAIAAVPEGLPAVATIALAVGLRRMARRNALIRRLHAVESLGSTTVICTDKTGTLTAGEMTVTVLVIGGREIAVSGEGYAPHGELKGEHGRIEPAHDEALATLLRAALLTARADIDERDGRWMALGDPTDAALLVLARKAGLSRAGSPEAAPLAGEVPFSSARQYMASFHRGADGALTAYVKGAPHRVLEQCTRAIANGGVAPLDDDMRAHIRGANDELAGRGLRVLALATGVVDDASERALHDLTFVGIAGMIDPPAEGVHETIRRFREAGIRTVMITGDQRRTAEAIARDLKLLGADDATLDGRELQQMSEQQLAEDVHRVAVYSRVSPEDKLKIVAALKRRGEIVAMLGDGVNDAAALKKADVGVAMGVRGTDVARETAAVVLRDDRFATIGAAIEEGRVIFDNIRKFIFYLFSCNLGEVLVLFLASLIGWPLPLLPLQILWLNLVTDTFPALSLAMEPAEPGVMQRPPRDPQSALLSQRFVSAIALYALLIALVTLVAFRIALVRDAADHTGAMALAFTTLALAQLFHLGNARSPATVLRGSRIIANRFALSAVALVIALQLLALYWPPVTTLLRLRPLTLLELGLTFGLGVIPAVGGQLLRVLRPRA